MSIREEAAKRHASGYNCAQAVACALADAMGVDEVTAFKAAEGFGLGMGGMESVCGAIAGAAMAAGFKNSCGDLENPTSKGATHKLSKAIVDGFKEKNGAILCKDLKGVETGTPLRACRGCVEDAAEIAAQVLGLE